MTIITIISSLTTVGGSGKVTFDLDLEKITVGGVKILIEQATGVNAEEQKLWWRGYILDEEDKLITKACVGVNEGETIDSSIESLLLFMTVDITKRELVDDVSISTLMARSPSFVLRETEPNSASQSRDAGCRLM